MGQHCQGQRVNTVITMGHIAMLFTNQVPLR